MPHASDPHRPRTRGSSRRRPSTAIRLRFASECCGASNSLLLGGDGVIAACLALAAWVAVPAPPDTFAFELRRAGGFEHLSGGPSRPVEPAGLAFDSFGRIYVTDAALRRLVRFAADGRFLGETGALGDDVAGLRRPGAVTTAGVLQMAVLDEENHRIVTYDLLGHVQG